MHRLLLTVIALFAASVTLAQPKEDVWSTATTEHLATGRRVIFRYVDEFRSAPDRASTPYVVVLSWRYRSADGLPEKEALDAMYDLEDRLTATAEDPGFAKLVLISTGNNVRLWTYYAKSDRQFRSIIALSLTPINRFPIEVSSKFDPNWSEYARFQEGVQRK